MLKFKSGLKSAKTFFKIVITIRRNLTKISNLRRGFFRGPQILDKRSSTNLNEKIKRNKKYHKKARKLYRFTLKINVKYLYCMTKTRIFVGIIHINRFD